MKILIATGLYPPDIGGPATYSKLLNDTLPRDYGVETLVASFGSVRRFPKLIRHFLYIFLLIKNVKGVDIIYAQDPVSVGLPSLVVSKLFRKRFVLKVVGDFAWEQFQQKRQDTRNPASSTASLELRSSRRLRGASKKQNDDSAFVTLEEFQEGTYDSMTELRKNIERYVGKKASKIIVPSEYLKKIVLLWGVPEERIQVIYNAFSLSDEPKEDVATLRKELELDGTIFLTAGRLVPWKGVDMLIEIMPKVLKEIPDATLVIAGDGPERDRLESLARDHALKDKVLFLGRVPHDVLLRVIKASDLFVLNTGYEGLSHQLLEVMALGTPIITTDVGGNPELIEHNKTGVLLPYNDSYELARSIITLTQTKTRASELADNARASLSRFEERVMMSKLISELM